MICGIAEFGNPDLSIHNKLTYNRYRSMISRCYNPNDKDYCRYGAIGVSVSKEWLTYSNYLNDLKYLPGYEYYLNNPNEYVIDKDILSKN